MDLWRTVGGGGAIASVVLLSLAGMTAQAQEGTLIAQDANAQINLRTQANTQADIVDLGNVGDRIQVLERIPQAKAPGWYRIKRLRSGKVGWVRADFVKIGSPSQPVAQPKALPPKTAPVISPTAKATHPATAPNPNPPPAPPIPLKPPKALPAQPSPPTAKALPPSTPQPPEDAVTIVAFKTPTYAVRVFSEAGHLRLNLFNRKSQQLALQAVPIESQIAKEATVYRYTSDVKVTVTVPTTGTPTLTTFALGNTALEPAEAETVPTPAAADPAPKTAPH